MMNVPVGPSTIAVWLTALLAAVTAAIDAIQNGMSWQVVILGAVAAGIVALNNLGRSYQAAKSPNPDD